MPSWESLTSTPALLAAGALGLSTALWIRSRTNPGATTQQTSAHAADPKAKMAQAAASVMSPPAQALNPPKNDPISVAELAKYDGKDSSKPVYVAIKGKVFDVSNKREMYGEGGSYHIFAGKDASKGLGMSSLDAKDAVADYSGLNEAQRKTLDQWESFFEKRYNIVGKVQP